MAAGIHAHRTTDRTRHADRPFESRQSGCGGAPRQDRQCHAAAGGDHVRAVDRSAVDVADRSRTPSPAIETAIPAKPSSATSMFEPRPTTSTGTPVSRRTSAIDRQIVDAGGVDEQRRRATDPIGRHRRERHVDAPPDARVRRRAARRRDRVACDTACAITPPAAWRRHGEHLVGQRSDVAAAHRDTHIAVR